MENVPLSSIWPQGSRHVTATYIDSIERGSAFAHNPTRAALMLRRRAETLA